MIGDAARCDAMRCGTAGMPPRCRRRCLAPSPHRGKQLRSLMWSLAVSAGTPWVVLSGPWRRLSQRRAEEAGTVDARLALRRSAALLDHRGGGRLRGASRHGQGGDAGYAGTAVWRASSLDEDR